MAVKLDDLVPSFRSKVEELLARCKSRGIEMRPNAGVRGVEEQAKLWRQSRATEEIKAAIGKLRSDGAPYLAEVLDGVGPQHGERVTNALPGLSWHQWGEAVDCFWVVNGKASWEIDELVNGVNGYMVYAAEASQMGLDAGGLWSSLKDWPHVQLRKGGTPLSLGMTWDEIDRAMQQRFA